MRARCKKKEPHSIHWFPPTLDSWLSTSRAFCSRYKRCFWNGISVPFPRCLQSFVRKRRVKVWAGSMCANFPSRVYTFLTLKNRERRGCVADNSSAWLTAGSRVKWSCLLRWLNVSWIFVAKVNAARCETRTDCHIPQTQVTPLQRVEKLNNHCVP